MNPSGHSVPPGQSVPPSHSVQIGPPVIGVIGGIGSGKSFVAREYARRWPVAIIDGDVAGHRVLDDPEVIQQIREAFGDEVITAEGRVDRKRVSQRVFGSGQAELKAREVLEGIVHPRIRQLLSEQIAEARSQPGLQAILLDAAVLLETGWRSLCDVIVFIECPWEERLERVSQSRGWTAADLAAREASQLPLDQKRKEADFVIVNSRKQPAEFPSLEQILHPRTHPAGSAKRAGPG